VAATYYILAEAFDQDPFLVLAWRGRPRERLLERLRDLRGAAPAPDDAPAAALDAPADELAPAADFWRAGPELAELRFTPRAAETPDAILREMGPLPDAAGGHPVAAALAEAYRIFTIHAEHRAFGDGDVDGAGELKMPQTSKESGHH
jgi:uncharacterized Zn finger protein